MTRLTDDLYERRTAAYPTPVEIERRLKDARQMRSTVVAAAFADLRRTVARVVAVQPRGRRAGRATG